MTPGRYQSFESVAGDYDLTRVIPDALLAEITQLLSRDAKLAQGGLFLDAGVGTGRFAAPLASAHPTQVIGIDISPAMMARIQRKSAPGRLSLAQADLQRLPFGDGVFAGVLLVHILHLIEQWPLVLTEVRRVLAPETGILFLGVEMGGRSALVDFYYEQARIRALLPASLGAPGLAQVLSFLSRPERDGGIGAQVTTLDLPRLAWRRVVPISRTLEALSRRTYSQMWAISDAAHQDLLAETHGFARRTFRRPDAVEVLKSRFMMHTARWIP